MLQPSDLTQKSIANSFNAFAVELMKQVAGVDENAVFSPFSIAMALSMIWIGAKSSTATEIAQSLHLSVTPQVLSDAANTIIETMSDIDPKGKNQLHVANALWMKQGYSILQSYREAIRGNFKGDLFEVAFSAGETVRDEINTWVAKQTNNRIPQLLPPGSPNPDSVLVLTNAIYFLGAWLHVFPARNTQDLPFFTLLGWETRVPTMHIEADFGYMENVDLQYLEMPYVGDTLAMGIVLPREWDDVHWRRKLSAEYFADLAENATEQEVNVFLPRFKLESTLDLTTELGKMGIKAAFQKFEADFSSITGDPAGVFISAVVHKAFVDVSEKGTEAAAATAIAMLPSGVSDPTRREPPTFRADHPFLFLIRHTRLNAILFLGKVVLPRR